MKKSNLVLLSVSALSTFALVVPTVASATTVGTVNTTGTVGYYAQNTPVTPGNPGSPTNPGTNPGGGGNPDIPGTPGNPSTPQYPTPVNPGDPGTPGTPGNPSYPGEVTGDGAMAFYVPNLNFGYHPIDTAGGNYYAYAAPFSVANAASTSTNPSYNYYVGPQQVQVDDWRATDAGWNVTVQETQQFTPGTPDANGVIASPTGNPLAGATITFNTTGAGNTIASASSHPTTLTDSYNQKAISIGLNQTAVIFDAVTGTGDGINSLNFGTSTAPDATPAAIASGAGSAVTTPLSVLTDGFLDSATTLPASLGGGSFTHGNPADNRGASIGNGIAGFVNEPVDGTATPTTTAPGSAELNPNIALNVAPNTEGATTYTADLLWSLNNTPA